MFDTLTAGDLIQGGCGLIALFLAFQIKFKLAEHETRITALEKPHVRSRNRSSKSTRR